jgi:hypothetical protein
VFLAGEVARALTLPVDWTRRADQLRAGSFATLVTGLLVAAIVIGSRNLQNFDAALVVYTFAVIFASWGVAYHYHVWRQKPPTALYWERGRELLRRRRLAGLLSLGPGPRRLLELSRQGAAPWLIPGSRSRCRGSPGPQAAGRLRRREHRVRRSRARSGSTACAIRSCR